MAHEELPKALAHHDHAQHEDMVGWSGKSSIPRDARTLKALLSILTGSRKNGSPGPGNLGVLTFT
jgi:hypothetical protein